MHFLCVFVCVCNFYLALIIVCVILPVQNGEDIMNERTHGLSDNNMNEQIDKQINLDEK